MNFFLNSKFHSASEKGLLIEQQGLHVYSIYRINEQNNSVVVRYSSCVFIPFYTASRLNSSGIVCFDQLTRCIIQCSLKNGINKIILTTNRHIPSYLALAVEIARDTITNHIGFVRQRYLTIVPFGYNGNKKHGLEKVKLVNRSSV